MTFISDRARTRRVLRLAVSAAAGVALALAAGVSLSGCSAEQSVTSGMDDTVRQVRDRVAAAAEHSGSVAELERRLRTGESYTLLLIDATADDILATKPFPTTAMTALRTDGGRVIAEVFTTGHGSRSTGWFGEQSVNLFGCAAITAEAGGRTTVRGTECGTTVRTVFARPWQEERLRP